MSSESTIEDKVREALLAELRRQADGGKLKVGGGESGDVEVSGRFNVDDVALAITGAVAGGP